MGPYDDILGITPTNATPQKKKGPYDDILNAPVAAPAAPVESDGALTQSYNEIKSSVGVTNDLISGDSASAAKNLAGISAYRDANPASEASKRISTAFSKDDVKSDKGFNFKSLSTGLSNLDKGVANVAGTIYDDLKEKGVGAAWDDVGALGTGLLKQVPNMVLPLVGMGAGTAAGTATAGPVGAVVGGVAGASVGNAYVEGGGMVADAISKAGIDLKDTEAVAKYISDNRAGLLTSIGIKGTIIGAVDRFTAGAANKILSKPLDAAMDRGLAKLGVSLTDDVAVAAAKKSPELAKLVAEDAVFKAATSGLPKLARDAVAFSLDPAGEFTGEFVGTGVATGEWDVKNAGLEAISSLGQSAVMFGGQKAYQAITYPLAGVNFAGKDLSQLSDAELAAASKLGGTKGEAADALLTTRSATNAAAETPASITVDRQDDGSLLRTTTDATGVITEKLFTTPEGTPQWEVADKAHSSWAPALVTPEQAADISTQEGAVQQTAPPAGSEQTQEVNAEPALAVQTPVETAQASIAGSDVRSIATPTLESIVNGTTASEPAKQSAALELGRRQEETTNVATLQSLLPKGVTVTAAPSPVLNNATSSDRGSTENRAGFVQKANGKVAETVASLFGRKIQWATFTDSQGGIAANGALDPNNNKTIYINPKARHPVLQVLGHELLHSLKVDNVDIYSELIGALKVNYNEGGHKAAYPSHAKMAAADRHEEFAGDMMGENFTKPEFWSKVADNMPQGFGKFAVKTAAMIAKTLRQTDKTLQEAGMSRYEAERFTKDMNAAQDALAKALAKWKAAQDATKAAAPATQESDEAKMSGVQRKGTKATIGAYEVIQHPDGSMTVFGDTESIRQSIPENVKGRASEGSILFTNSDAPRVKAGLEGRNIAYSRGGAVLDKKPMKDGKYLGAPTKFNTPAKVKALREWLQQLTTEGAPGRYWYENSSREILRMVGGDVNEARKFVALLAIYSPQAKVDTNTTFALRAWSQYKAGQPISVKTGVMDAKAQSALDNVDEFWSGEKTGNFFHNLLSEIDPATKGKQGATIDMWMMRAAYYDTDAPTATQYSFMEDETNRIALAMGWEPQQVQAAIWVAMKARMENKGVKVATEETSAKKKWIKYDAKGVRVILDAQKHRDNWLKHAFEHDPTKQDTATAKFDFSDGVLRHIGQVSFEARPGVSSGVLPGIHNASYEDQVAYHQAIQNAFYDESGNDLLAMQLGMLVDNDLLAPGVWQGQVSPSTQKSVAMAPASGDMIKKNGNVPIVDPTQHTMLDLYASIAGLVTKQEGVGWHRPFYTATKTASNGVEVDMGRAITPEESAAVSAAINQWMIDNDHETFVNWEGKTLPWNAGFAIISAPKGVRLVNFGVISNSDLQKSLLKAIDPVLPDAIAHDAFASDGNMPTNNWKENPNGSEYIQRASAAGRSDVLKWASDFLAPRVQRINEEFSAKYNWGNSGEQFVYEEIVQSADGSTSDARISGDGRGRAKSGSVTPLQGAPSVPGFHGPDPRIVAIAERYASENGINLKRQAEYVAIDPARAKRLADAYEAMPNAPQDANVKEAYANLIKQTTAQYEALAAAGYKFWFLDMGIPSNVDYASTPWNAMRDTRANQQMGVFPTSEGFGSSELDVSNNPLLADTGFEWPSGSLDGKMHKVLANDLFRAVHDAFGHGLEGAGFRAQGEENAWQAHVRLFTGSAVAAITSETRGQNSWVNYGPNAETNATANGENTVFADQKTGLMPEWTWKEGLAADQDSGVKLSAVQTETPAFKKWFADSKVVDADGNPLEVFHGSVNKGVTVFDTSLVTKRANKGDLAGTYFTGDINSAYGYTRKLGSKDPRGDVTRAYLSIKNPLNTTSSIKKFIKRGMSFGDAKREALKALTPEHDGVIFDGNAYNSSEYVVFNPTQIKSATNNNGDFDATNSDIRFSSVQSSLSDENGKQLTALWGMLMRKQGDTVFRYPRSESDNLKTIASDVSKGKASLTTLDWQTPLEGETLQRLDLSIPSENGADKQVSAYISKQGDSVWINVASFKEGSEGALVYSIVGNWAYNNGYKFVGDPNGLSDAALTRRLQNMLSLSIKFNDTDFVKPHQRQLDKLKDYGFEWVDGDYQKNLQSMLNTSYTINSLMVPEVTNVNYNFKTNKFESNGKRFTDEDFVRAASKVRGLSVRGAPGWGTLKVTATIGTILRKLQNPSRLGASSEDMASEISWAIYSSGMAGAGTEAQREGGSSGLPDLENETGLKGVMYSHVQTNTPEFKKWFGDSKVVGTNRQPLVVYHGTSYAFDGEFMGNEVVGWFTEDPALTDRYLSLHDEAIEDDGGTPAPQVLPVFLSIKNPLVLNLDMNDPATALDGVLKKLSFDSSFAQSAYSVHEIVNSADFMEAVYRAGFDGVRVKEAGMWTWGVDRQGQIKSAIGNNGNFDPANPDIRYSSVQSYSDELIAKNAAAINQHNNDLVQDYATQTMRDAQNLQAWIDGKRGVVPHKDSKTVAEKLAEENGYSADDMRDLMAQGSSNGLPIVDVLAAAFATSRVNITRMLTSKNKEEMLESMVETINLMIATRVHVSEIGRALSYVGWIQRKGGWGAALASSKKVNELVAGLDGPVTMTPEISRATKEFNRLKAKTADILMTQEEMRAELDAITASVGEAFAQNVEAKRLAKETEAQIRALKKAQEPVAPKGASKTATGRSIDAIRARLAAKFAPAAKVVAKLSSIAVDTQTLLDGMDMAAFHINNGVTSFGEYSAKMTADFGDGVKPYLISFWEAARNYPGMDQTKSLEDKTKELEAKIANLTPDVTKSAMAQEVAAAARKATQEKLTELRKNLAATKAATKAAEKATAAAPAKLAELEAKLAAANTTLVESQKALDEKRSQQAKVRTALDVKNQALKEAIAGEKAGEAALRKAKPKSKTLVTKEDLLLALGGDHGMDEVFKTLEKHGAKNATNQVLVNQYLQGMAKAITEQKKADNESRYNRFMKGWVELWRANILTGFFTHKVNIISTASNLALNKLIIEPIAAAMPGGLGAKKHFSVLFGMTKVLSDIKANMLFAMYTENQNKQLEHLLASPSDQQQQMLAIAGSKWMDDSRKALPGKFGRVVRSAGFTPLGMEDAVFKTIAFRYELAKQEAMGQPLDYDVALKAAQHDVFQSDVGSFARAINGVIKDRPEIAFIIPFIKTLSNIVDQSLKLFPATGVWMMRDQLMGKDGTDARNRAYATMIVGAALSTLAITLGGGDDEDPNAWSFDGLQPKDPAKRAVWLESHANMGLAVNGQHYDMSRMDPLASAMGLALATYKAAKFIVTSDPVTGAKQIDKALSGAVDAVWNLVLGKSWMSGSEQMLSDVSSGNFKGLTRFAKEIAISSVMPNMISQIGDMTDASKRAPYKAETWAGDEVWKGFEQSVARKIPGVRESLDPKLTLSGEEMPNPRNDLAGIIGMESMTPRNATVNRWLEKLNKGVMGEPDSLKGLPVEVKKRLLARRMEMLTRTQSSVASLVPELQLKAVDRTLSSWGVLVKQQRAANGLKSEAQKSYDRAMAEKAAGVTLN